MGDNAYVLRFVHRDGTQDEPFSDPDGRRLVVAEYADENTDLWIYDIARKSRTRFTFSPRYDIYCTWAPDGKDIYYWRNDSDSVCRKAADGTGVAVPVINGGMPTLTPDMKYLVFKRAMPDHMDDIYYVEMEGGNPRGEAVALIATPADEDTPQMSPVGGYLAYDSDESGGWELYVTPFPSGDGKWQVTLGDYEYGGWGADGKALYFSTVNNDVYEVLFNVGPNGVELSTPRLVFRSDQFNLTATPARSIAQSPTDLNKFVIVNPLETKHRETNTSLTLVENWFSEFRQP